MNENKMKKRTIATMSKASTESSIAMASPREIMIRFVGLGIVIFICVCLPTVSIIIDLTYMSNGKWGEDIKLLRPLVLAALRRISYVCFNSVGNIVLPETFYVRS